MIITRPSNAFNQSPPSTAMALCALSPESPIVAEISHESREEQNPGVSQLDQIDDSSSACTEMSLQDRHHDSDESLHPVRIFCRIMNLYEHFNVIFT
jgi:hypothetical protein